MRTSSIETDATAPEEGAEPPSMTLRRPEMPKGLVGFFFGFLAAVLYTSTNINLRSVARSDDLDWAMWVTCNKAIPPATIAWIVVATRAWKGLPALPPRRMVPRLLAAGLIMQLGGNIFFQVALGMGGLALTVPLVFSTILLSGAILGRMILGEPIDRRSVLAILTLMVAIVVLSEGAGEASAAVSHHRDFKSVALAVLCALCSGTAYGFNGVIIRGSVSSNVSSSATIIIISTTGVVVYGLLSLVRLGPSELLATPPELWSRMIMAGVFNAGAFFSIALSFKYLSVTHVNLINASQAAMAAVAGIYLFREPITPWLVLGVILTFVGIAMISKPRRPAPPMERQSADE